MIAETMSEEQRGTFEEHLATLDKLVSLMRIVIGGAVGLGIWAGTLQYQVWANAKNLDIHGNRLEATIAKEQAIELALAKNDASQFTAQEHNKYAIATGEQIAQMDKRVSRVEDAITGIKDGIRRIEDKLEIQRNGKQQ